MPSFQSLIEDQVDSNQSLLINLPYHCNFAKVWQPETLSYKIEVVWDTVDRGWEIINPDADSWV